MVIGAYCEALVTGKRVAVLGDSSTGLAEQLGKASGRALHVFDPDRARAAASLASKARRDERAPTVAALEPAALELHQGAFDVVLIADLATFAEPAAMLTQAAALLSARGCAVVAVPRPATDQPASEAALGYYELYDLVSATFAEVRMLGQAPFSGFTMADFVAGEDPALSVDTSLMSDTEEPEWFVAVASRQPVELEPFTIVEVPVAALRAWRHRHVSRTAERQGDDRSAQARRSAAEAEAQAAAKERRAARLAEERRAAAEALSVRVAELEAELEAQRTRHAHGLRAAREQAETQRQQLRRAEAQGQELEGQVAELERELDEANSLVVELEEGQAELRALLDEEPEVEQTEPLDQRSVQGYEFQLAELRKSLDQARGQRDALVGAAQKAEQLEAELAKLRQGQLAAGDEPAHAIDDAVHASDIARLEKALLERANLVESLQTRLRTNERTARELARDLEAARAQAAPALPSPASEPTAEEQTEPTAATALAQGTAEGSALEQTQQQAAGQEPNKVELRQRLAVLAARTSRLEADLEAANWTISSLRSELAEQQTDDDPSDLAKLEEALRAAQLELSSLRRSLHQSEAPAEPEQ